MVHPDLIQGLIEFSFIIDELKLMFEFFDIFNIFFKRPSPP